jgi:hypothetical protein
MIPWPVGLLWLLVGLTFGLLLAGCAGMVVG